MSAKVLLASADEPTLERMSQVLAEADNVTLVRVVRDAAGVREAVSRTPDVDVLVIDVDLEDGHGLAVARAIGAANPLLGIVMLVDVAGPEQFAAAMDSGARSVVSRSGNLAEIVGRLDAVAQWAASARAAVTADASGGRGGKVVAVAGAKGGVGTSAVALLMAQSLVGARTVGVADFDLQSGDLAAYLGVHTRRSVVDLVDIAGEMTGRILREISYDVPGGLRLLSAPNDGERGEEMTAAAARAVVGGLRFQYDVSVIDVGSHLSEVTAAVLEEADAVVLVVTPDLPALRAARRTLAMWERLAVRPRSGVRVVVNRQHKRNEVTTGLAAKIIEVQVETTVPDGGTAFESAMNTASVVSASGPAHAALASLAERLVDAAPTQAEEALDELAAVGGPRRRARRDAGQAAIDLPVAVGIAMLIFLACVQGLAWGATHLLARQAAYEGARTVGLQAWGPGTVDDAREDAIDELAGFWRGRASVDVSPTEVTVSLRSPVIVPNLDLDATVTAPVQDER